MIKYGGPGKMKQKCIGRQCLHLSRHLYSADPLQSSSLTLQQEMAKKLAAAGEDPLPPVSKLEGSSCAALGKAATTEDQTKL